MSKIGILTFHRSLNYGAFMQAYSLWSKVTADFPNDEVEIIDYTSAHIQDKYSYNAITFIFSSLSEWKRSGIVTALKATVKNFLIVLKNPEFLKKRKRMRMAFEEALSHIKLSDEKISTDDLNKVNEWLDGRYDYIIVGSDCVWEFNNYPFPNIYYLHDIKNAKKLSYAACAQGVLYEKTNDFQRKYMRESWNDFSYLGVRDASTEKLVKKVDGSLEVYHNCDPTVFLDIEKLPVDMQKLREKFEKAGMDFSKPAVCLMGNEAVGKICKEILGDTHQIVAVFEESKYANCFICDLNPFEWAKCFSFFDITFTNRFHGTLLSLKNGVSPVTFDFAAADHSFSNKGNTKIRDVYDRLGLTDKHYFIGKREYSDAEKEQIKVLVTELLNSNEKAEIFTALEKEAHSYNDFLADLKN